MRDEPPAVRTRRVWDTMASRYDRSVDPLERLLLRGERPWLGARVTGRVLEVAIGTGRNLPHYPAEATVVGVDLSTAMLAVAARRATGLGREVTLLQADAGALPFVSGSFDTVVCTLGLCEVPEPRSVVAELARVLRPGGRLLLLDHVASTWWPVRAGQWLMERVTIRTTGEHLTRRPALLLPAAGLRIVAHRRRLLGMVELVVAAKPPADGEPAAGAPSRG